MKARRVCRCRPPYEIFIAGHALTAIFAEERPSPVPHLRRYRPAHRSATVFGPYQKTEWNDVGMERLSPRLASLE